MRRKIFRRYIHHRISHSTTSTAAPWTSGSYVAPGERVPLAAEVARQRVVR